MQDCYKTMVSDLCNWSSTFTGKDAKYMDACSPSIGSNLITIKKWVISDALTDQNLIGGTVPDGRGCWQFAEWTKWTPYVA